MFMVVQALAERDGIAMNELGFHQGYKYHEHFMKGPCPYGASFTEKEILEALRSG
jgi:hypothetical protein